MTNPNDPGAAGKQRRSHVLLNAALIGVSAAVALVLAELILRVAPIPGVSFHSFYYDDVTGGRYYPHSTFVYRNDRGDHVRRQVNSWGYLDEEHALAKNPGTVRIGFFGESYTQAAQVPIEETFFRLIEHDLNEDARLAGRTETHYETIAFGVSGFGTLQSYLESHRWTNRTDLDYAVYVFVENDPGAHLPVINRSNEVPYPRISGDSVVVDDSFNQRYAYKASRLHRAQQAVKAHSLVVSTVVSRLKLLREHGIKTSVTPDERQMAVKGDKTRIPDPGWAPSTWPDTLRDQAADVSRRVMDKWAADVKRSGRKFIVIYIPREREMAKPYADQDTWAEWLMTTCETRGIPVVDPSPFLLERKARSEEVFYDHLAAKGHVAVADAFVKFFETTYPEQ